MDPVIQAAITDLETRRERIDAAIMALRGMYPGLPQPVQTPKAAQVGRQAVARRQPSRSAARPPAVNAGPDGALSGKVLDVLRGGRPQSGVAIAAVLKVDVAHVRTALASLVESKRVHSVGAGRWIQWYLGAAARRSEPKEAPWPSGGGHEHP